MIKSYQILIVTAFSVCLYILYTTRFITLKNGIGLKRRVNGLARTSIDRSADRERIMEESHNLVDLRSGKYFVMAFIHIQKTGGTYLEKLLTQVEGLECRCPLPKRIGDCKCLRPRGDPWIVMRYVSFQEHIAWPCGVHPDYSVVANCVPKLMHENYGEDFNPKVFYFTLLRDPVTRYLSEFRHVQRGATWANANVKCKFEKNCYGDVNWSDASLKDFMKCKWNLANNRQTRMLADLRSINCSYFFAMNNEERGKFLFKSAKEVLRNMIYFAIIEKPAESQFIFERTFNVTFAKDWKLLNTGYTKEYMKNVSSEEVQKIKEINYLDMKLYNFGLKLFAKKLANIEKIFSEKPKDTQVMEHKKKKIILQKNWKNARMKMKNGKRKVKRKKKRASTVNLKGNEDFRISKGKNNLG